MLNVDTDTYKRAVAEAIIKARDNLKDHDDTIIDHGVTLDDHDAELGSHATELGSHATSIDALDTLTGSLKYAPSTCWDNGGNYWIWAVSIVNHRLYRLYYGGGGWSVWYLVQYSDTDRFYSGPSVTYVEPYFHIAAVGANGSMWYNKYHWTNGFSQGWTNLHGGL